MENKAQDDDLVMNLVELALGQPEQERRAYLQRACAGETELFEQAWEYVQWESRMQGFLLEPLYSPPVIEHPFETGELLDGRFRILREIAQGGMGVVYEAMDERLDRRIAIKCAKTGFRKRLPPEVRHAREITHPNVCKIFEIHTARTQAGEIDFVTMEYLEGETLADRLKRGPLPEAEARAIARQLCSGLAEAHSKGVIHGDLKSNNVILTKVADASTRSVITDFGMSRATEVAQSTMQSGPRGGTPDYMAPELLKGEKASVASDIYALGVMLHELVSGRKPAAGAAIVVHPKWNPIVAKCLAADPENRYANATQIAQAFEPPRTRRWFLMAAAAVLVATITGVVTYQRATAPTEVVRLAMLPFASTQDMPLADNLLGATATQIARIKSSARTRLIVIPLSSTLRNKVDTAVKARTAFGATHVLSGTVQTQSNGDPILQVFLTDTRSGVNVREWRARYTRRDFPYAPVALAGMVTGTLHLPPVAFSAEVNAAARQDYQAGVAAVQRDGGVDTALALMERAVAADPASPLTYAGLAEAQWFKYAITEDNRWLERATESVRQAENRNMDLAQVHSIAGLLKKDAGWYEQAISHYLRAIEIDPNDNDAYRRLGEVYQRNSQLDEALTAFQKAVALNPGQYRNHRDLGDFYRARADYTEAAMHYRKAVELAPEEPSMHFGLGQAYEDLGEFTSAESELRLAVQLRETPLSLHALGVVLLYEGRDNEAVPNFVRALGMGTEKYIWWMNLGIAYRRVGLSADAERANRRGLALAEAEMIKNPRSGFVRSHLAYLCAWLGDRRRAESEIAQAVQQSPSDADTLWMAAVTYEALGKRDQTLSVLAGSPAGVLADLSRWPDVADIRRDSRFLELLTSHGIK
jgi:serine/threonine protein kinase